MTGLKVKVGGLLKKVHNSVASRYFIKIVKV
jgi:hypothetical protein